MRPDLSWCCLGTCERCDAKRLAWKNGACVNRDDTWSAPAVVGITLLVVFVAFAGVAIVVSR